SQQLAPMIKQFGRQEQNAEFTILDPELLFQIVNGSEALQFVNNVVAFVRTFPNLKLKGGVSDDFFPPIAAHREKAVVDVNVTALLESRKRHRLRADLEQLCEPFFAFPQIFFGLTAVCYVANHAEHPRFAARSNSCFEPSLHAIDRKFV